MTQFLFTVVLAAAMFLLGYWVAGHPDDTRKFFQRLRDRIAAKKDVQPPPSPPPSA